MSNLNHTKDEERSLKILRDAYENDGIEYVSIDTDESDLMWSVKNGTLYGGMINIKGVGEKKAKDLIKAREGKMKFTTSMLQHMAFPETPYDILYPCKHYWGDIYDNHGMYGLASPPDFIKNVNDSGSYLIIGQVKGKDLRDLNEYNEVMKRGGKVYDKDNLFLKIIVADDTDQIQCKIDRKDFVAMKGQELSDKLVDNTWVIIRGKIRDGNWRILLIQQISILTELYPEGLEANVQN
jgi:DNA polymerase III alpha subunit (gram-positive type)